MLRILASSTLFLLALSWPAQAQVFISERDQPMDVDADELDGEMTENSVSRLIGNVIIRQGGLDVRADLAVITTRDGEIWKVELEGEPVLMSLTDRNGEQTKGQSNRVEYRLPEETIVFTDDVFIEQPRGNVRGERVVYNLGTGRIDGGGDGSRIQLRIKPKAIDELGVQDDTSTGGAR